EKHTRLALLTGLDLRVLWLPRPWSDACSSGGVGRYWLTSPRWTGLVRAGRYPDDRGGGEAAQGVGEDAGAVAGAPAEPLRGVSEAVSLGPVRLRRGDILECLRQHVLKANRHADQVA